MPTPSTIESARVVTTWAAGAPELELVAAVAPIAPEPFVPDVSAPMNAMTVIDDITACDSVAVTVTLVSGLGANARQISDVPACVFERTTSTHVSPAPVTLVTVVLGPVR